MPRERLMGLLEGRMEMISGEFDSEDVPDTLEEYALMERKPGERLMGLLEGRADATSGEFDLDDVSQITDPSVDMPCHCTHYPAPVT